MPKLIYNGGIIPNQPDINIPVYENTSSFSINKNELPSANVYTVSANSINLEFSKANKDIDFEIFANDKSLLRKPIDKEVFTLQYDFVTPLRIELKKDNEVIDSHYVFPELISRKVLLQDDKYYYITSEGIKTNDKVIKGDFVNIYKGLALTSNGELVNLTTGKVISDKYYYITSEGIKTNDKVIKGDFVNIYKGLALTSNGELVNLTTGKVISYGIKGVKSLDMIIPLFRFNL